MRGKRAKQLRKYADHLPQGKQEEIGTYKIKRTAFYQELKQAWKERHRAGAGAAN